MQTVKDLVQYIEYIVNYIMLYVVYIIKHIENIIEIVFFLVDATVGISSFFVIIIITVLAGIIASIYLSVQTTNGENYFNAKESNLNKEEIISKWLRTLKKTYWYGFAFSLLITPFFLLFPVPVSIRGYLFAVIVLSWIFGYRIMIIAFSKLKKSFSKKYMSLAILALYISYWYLCLWMLISFYALLNPD